MADGLLRLQRVRRLGQQVSAAKVCARLFEFDDHVRGRRMAVACDRRMAAALPRAACSGLPAPAARAALAARAAAMRLPACHRVLLLMPRPPPYTQTHTRAAFNVAPASLAPGFVAEAAEKEGVAVRCLLLDLFGGSGHYLGSPQRGMAFPAKGLAEHVLQLLLRAPAPGLTKVEHSLSHTLTPPPPPHRTRRSASPRPRCSSTPSAATSPATCWAPTTPKPASSKPCQAARPARRCAAPLPGRCAAPTRCLQK